MINAAEALERLKKGNKRFIEGNRKEDQLSIEERRAKLLKGQKPFAVILGCSDSRVPAEIVFDQGLGTLFVIRIAGNVVAPSQIGSTEFAVATFGTPLVVVMGHSDCGAVEATLEQIQKPTGNQSRNLDSIVQRIRPAVETLLETDLKNDKEKLLSLAVRANVRIAANHLRHGSRIIEQLVEEDKLTIVGAEYVLESGAVDFFDGVEKL